MRASFSPTQEAARRLAARTTSSSSNPPHLPAGAEPRWCEWPRRGQSPARPGGIWRALQAIQARHA